MVVRPDRFGIQMRLADRFFLGVRQMVEKCLHLPEMTKDWCLKTLMYSSLNIKDVENHL
jgi:hypothetical protein